MSKYVLCVFCSCFLFDIHFSSREYRGRAVARLIPRLCHRKTPFENVVSYILIRKQFLHIQGRRWTFPACAIPWHHVDVIDTIT